MATVTYRAYPSVTVTAEGPPYNDVAQARWVIPDGPDLWLLSACTRYYKTGATAGERLIWEAWDGLDLLWRGGVFTTSAPNQWGTYQCQPVGFWHYVGGLGDYSIFTAICPLAPLAPGNHLCLRAIDYDSAGDIFEPWELIFWHEDVAGKKRPQPTGPRPVPPYKCKLVAR